MVVGNLGIVANVRRLAHRLRLRLRRSPTVVLWRGVLGPSVLGGLFGCCPSVLDGLLGTPYRVLAPCNVGRGIGCSVPCGVLCGVRGGRPTDRVPGAARARGRSVRGGGAGGGYARLGLVS